MENKISFDFEKGELLLVDKPKTWTSFDVVKRIRGASRVKKVGHSGTLDPLATGLLLVAISKKTKTLNGLQGLDKEYTGSICIGGETPSYDLETEVFNVQPYDHINEELINKTAAEFLGPQDQIPPIFSAVKMKGQRSYIAARNGEEIKMEPRKVIIHEFEITKIELPEIYFRISCSKGTYIRSIAHDFGKKLSNAGYLSSLVRTKIGDFSLIDAWELTELTEKLKEYRLSIVEEGK